MSNIILGVTAGISAYKAVELLRLFQKAGHTVKVVETPDAIRFIPPLTFEALTGEPVEFDMFDRRMPHISLAKWADKIVIAPATADFIAGLAGGFANNLLLALCLSTKAPIYLAPAMNTEMWNKPVVQQNVAKLLALGFSIIPPVGGYLACGDVGDGRMAEPEDIRFCLLNDPRPRDLAGKRVLITAGGTREYLDPVRFISNASSGKMGVALALEAWRRGAEVTLLYGAIEIDLPTGTNNIPATSAQDLYNKAIKLAPTQDIIIMAAAVADYQSNNKQITKIKSNPETHLHLDLTPTRDILAELGRKKTLQQKLIGFCLETEKLTSSAKQKLQAKNLDLIVANDSSALGSENTSVQLIRKESRNIQKLKGTKASIAQGIVDQITELFVVPVQ